VTTAELQYAAKISPDELDLNAMLYAIRHLVGVYCLRTGQTPRTILDDEFANAPSDEFWRATIGATR
jgi:hypothetical protein